ncbi:nucleoside monophosphate kinase [bacterium]|nr:nucleoside monophosphate kinase [bacterium]
MIIVLLGPPASGKGTQAALLRDRYGFYHFDTGKVLRQEAATGSELGQQIASYINRGELVPIEIIRALIGKFIREMGEGRIMFDGFPRNLDQARVLGEGLADVERRLDHALYLNLDRSELMSRIINRRVCDKCGTIYNLVSAPPKSDMLCDRDSGNLVQRADDTEEVFARRLEVYFEQTVPVLDYYRERRLLREIPAEQPISELAASIGALLGLEEHAPA